MAAAAAAAAAAVAGVRTTKGLFLIFTLLSLVCFTSSKMDKERLKTLREKLQSAQKHLDKLKAIYESSEARNSELMSSIEERMALAEAAMKGLLPDIPPMVAYMKSIKRFVEKTKVYFGKSNEDLAVTIRESENKLIEMKKFIRFFEESHVEL
ncbi:hypothetical protein INR49_011687 [Caranx melampygus]|nr:hypothetical protein INR49_011687 [Caranx melampygus]